MASVPSPYLSWDILRPCLKCCDRLWISELAIFGECIGAIAWIPSALSLLLLISGYGLQPIWRRRPIWLRNFAAESPEEAEMSSVELGLPMRRNWSRSVLFLLVNSAVGLVLSLVASLNPDIGPLFLTPLIPHAVTCITLAAERPRSTPGLVLVVQGALFLIQLVMFSTILYVTTRLGLVWWILEMLVTVASVICILNMPLRDHHLGSIDICSPFQTPTSKLRSPEDSFTLWNWMSVGWMGPVVAAGCQRQLHAEDVWQLPLQFQHDRLHRLFRDVKGSVLMRTVKVNAPDLIITTFLGILESLCSLLPIVFLKELLTALEGENANRRVAVVYGVFILLVRLIGAQSGIFNLWFCRRAYERCRGELITMIYEKTLRRKAFTFPSNHNEKEGEKSVDKSKTNGGPASMGKILNLMRNDVYEVAQRFWEFANLVTKPMTFILTIVLIWEILGPAALGGVLLIVLAQLINVFTIRALVSWERARRGVTDVKLQLTSQFVEAIRHLRWYDWQDKWLGQILASRQKELRYRVIVNLINKAVAATNKISAYFFPVAAFYAYTMIGKQPLRVDIAFPALTLFTQLNQSLNELPGLVTVLLNASVAMGRIDNFMAEPNKDEEYDALGESGTQPAGELEIAFREASFSWPGSPPAQHVLSNVTFSAGPGLTAICGKVGFGKTALLHAILGELDDRGGTKKIPSEVAGYCAQTPWLQSMSIRENILFSSGLDEARYRQVLAACCLIPDLSNWKAGDLSLIGENGVGLSGGQRARVALARAIYSQARILLLDDPIAALDHQTAETILRNLFRNTDLMKGRMVFFVTHRMDILTRYADQVLEISQPGMVTVISREEINAHEELLHFAAEEEHRRESLDDEHADKPDEDVLPDKFIEEEHRAHGGVMMSVYWQYIKAGNLWYWAGLVVLFTVFRASRLAHYYFLKVWGEAYEDTATTQIYFVANNEPEHMFPSAAGPNLSTAASGDWWNINLDLPPPDADARPWLFWFFIIALLQFVSFMLSDLTIVLIIYTAGKHLFQQVMLKVANATFRFYDVTPVGRLMNRLTSDIGTIDGQIVTQIRDVAWYFMFWASSVFVIASTTPVFLLIAVIMTFLFIMIFMRFLPASQSLRRLEMVSLSPLMSNFGTLLEGLTTVRAFRAEPHFQNQIIITTEAFQRMDHFFWSLQAWLMFRFDILSALSTFILTMSALLTGLGAGTVGFVLGTAGNFVTCTHNLCRKYGDLQMQFVSVERVIELIDLEEEPRGDLDPPAAWPSYDDDIIFDKVTVRYAKGLDPSLRDISFRIPAGATVAVTGRTGSGKSTLALTLLGTILPEYDEATGTLGSIRIGSMDVARVDKHALRKRISFVAQDPVLFPGTLRDNLDPIGEHSDEECELVLRRVLGAADESGPPYSSALTLTTRVDGGGKNLSQGQRQLIGLGRAVLRRSPVVILDEATASIDKKTAFYIQKVLREELRQSTVITIAHRVEAVKDADFEIVLDKGKVVRAQALIGG
ncbi:P-loop containing nucleoside triphosphate hydrolase protein [Cryphonectria parasitica EP155]|uniref:P-loop containing nucleoside triphosphate hydrolase protein n=1 Tax=Cryphonectria parasitica (strain ATCC 38755 / EP155) TaxID=660469 RepID=A0A9P4Y423_CRYP1|nr:P-loop containing nucleoside triphosphate hydrolase protein [Cryphonectria parasitica EP155]KAF3766151.1 P-loop containing nucleoside triphosphate hydrolase protein [Cryphonectria parasitica EP155]